MNFTLAFFGFHNTKPRPKCHQFSSSCLVRCVCVYHSWMFRNRLKTVLCCSVVFVVFDVFLLEFVVRGCRPLHLKRRSFFISEMASLPPSFPPHICRFGLSRVDRSNSRTCQTSNPGSVDCWGKKKKSPCTLHITIHSPSYSCGD